MAIRARVWLAAAVSSSPPSSACRPNAITFAPSPSSV